MVAMTTNRLELSAYVQQLNLSRDDRLAKKAYERAVKHELVAIEGLRNELEKSNNKENPFRFKELFDKLCMRYSLLLEKIASESTSQEISLLQKMINNQKKPAMLSNS